MLSCVLIRTGSLSRKTHIEDICLWMLEDAWSYEDSYMCLAPAYNGLPEASTVCPLTMLDIILYPLSGRLLRMVQIVRLPGCCNLLRCLYVSMIIEGGCSQDTWHWAPIGIAKYLYTCDRSPPALIVCMSVDSGSITWELEYSLLQALQLLVLFSWQKNSDVQACGQEKPFEMFIIVYHKSDSCSAALNFNAAPNFAVSQIELYYDIASKRLE